MNNPETPRPLAPTPLLKPTDAARYLGLTLATIYTKASRRQLPTVKIGRALRFRLTDLDNLIKAGERPALRPIDGR